MMKIKLIFTLVVFFVSSLPAASEQEALWTKLTNGSANKDDLGVSIALDKNNNLYAAGYVSVLNQNRDTWLGKYDANGNELWVRTYNGSDNGDDRAFAVAVDKNNNIYLAGDVFVKGRFSDIWLRKYNPDGEELWTRTYNGKSNLYDVGYGVTVDKKNNVYLAGFESITNDDTRILVRKYDSEGNELWTKFYDGAAKGFDVARGITVDKNCAVYVTGYETVVNEGTNIWTRKYDTDGNPLWTQTYDAGSNEMGLRVAVDKNSNVYVSGFEVLALEGENLWLRKYDPEGRQLWTKTYNDQNNGNEIGIGITTVEEGSLYLTGYETAAGQGRNILLRKYDTEGNFLAKRTYNNEQVNGEDIGYDLTVDKSGNIYLIGEITVAGRMSDIWIRKYNKIADQESGVVLVEVEKPTLWNYLKQYYYLPIIITIIGFLVYRKLKSK